MNKYNTKTITTIDGVSVAYGTAQAMYGEDQNAWPPLVYGEYMDNYYKGITVVFCKVKHNHWRMTDGIIRISTEMFGKVKDEYIDKHINEQLQQMITEAKGDIVR